MDYICIKKEKKNYFLLWQLRWSVAPWPREWPHGHLHASVNETNYLRKLIIINIILSQSYVSLMLYVTTGSAIGVPTQTFSFQNTLLFRLQK